MTYLTVKEVAEITKHHPSTIYIWIWQGLPCIRKNGILIKQKDLDEWLDKYRVLNEQDYEDI